MDLAIFDLDNTLLDGDSDYLWGRYIADIGVVDRDRYEIENRRFHQQYLAGTLDIHAFASFTLGPLRENDPEQLAAWRRDFVRTVIEPIILPSARRLIARHRERGDELMIVTATNAFITEPIAAALGIEHLLATVPEMDGGRYTGRISGTPTFQHGKVARLQDWRNNDGRTFGKTFFYSDSHNDVPLMELADIAVAVDPDPRLQDIATQRHWPVVSLKSESGDAVFQRVTG